MGNTTFNYAFNGKRGKFPRKGKMINLYSPFTNLVDKDGYIKDFRTSNIHVDMDHPMQIEVVPEYDGSVNVIMNNNNDSPKLINSRFSALKDNSFVIPDRVGNRDTSFYNDEIAEIDTSLYKKCNTIPKLVFDGLKQDGLLKCGSYTFYFTLADDDGNETDFVAESGVVMVHYGGINDPKTIRMGMEDERTDKSITFHLSDIDESFDYVKVYYARTTSIDSGADKNSYFRILDKYPIDANLTSTILIYGTEETKGISLSDLNPLYNMYLAAKTQTICKNRLFLGNVTKDYIDYDLFREVSLHFKPHFEFKDKIGNLDYNYNDFSVDQNTKAGYYNTKNIYYRTGYWPEEYYRFGVTYIMADGTISPVFDVLGVDLYQLKDGELENADWDYFNEDGYIVKDGKVNLKFNKYGICRAKQCNLKQMLSTKGKPLAVVFDVNQKYLEKLNGKILGYFFVRQKRKPITIAQGVVIGKTTHDFGDWPVLKDVNGSYFTESFLERVPMLSLKDNKDSIMTNMLNRSYVYPDNDNVETKAVIIPEANLREPVFNELFTSREFNLRREAKINAFSFINNGKLIVPRIYNDCASYIKKAKLTQVNSGIKLITNGNDYFSSKAGIDIDIKEFKSVLHDWQHEGVDTNIGRTQKVIDKKDRSEDICWDLTTDRLIRGISGSYTGINVGDFDYGDIVSVKAGDFNEDELSYALKIKSLKNDHSEYNAISERYYYNDYDNKICYRGDCYICTVTQRMMRNFVDPDLPLTNRIIEPYAWGRNFLVLSMGSTYVDGKKFYVNQVLQTFKAKNFWHAKIDLLTWSISYKQCYKEYSLNSKNLDTISVKSDDGRDNIAFTAATMKLISILTLAAGDAANAFKDADHTENSEYTDVELYEDGKGTLFSVKIPGDARYEKAGNVLELMGIPNPWQNRGTDKINRSDVNNVQLGHWFTVRVLSNYNLNMRDIDIYHTQEKAQFNADRSFYPMRKIDLDNQFKIAESLIINGAANVYTPQRIYERLEDVPFRKLEYDTRIVFSNPNVEGFFKNGYRYFRRNQYIDYDKKYGSITKILEYNGNILSVNEHGIMVMAVDERVLTGSGAGGNVYVNSDSVLSKIFLLLSNTYGSIWIDSVIKTPLGIVYGVDTSAKKIWMINNNKVEVLSDFRLQEFLNLNIDLNEWNRDFELCITNVKTHYNASKNDVIFTFYHNDLQWNVCYNELKREFTTFYTWTPSYSENINNVFFSFDLEDTRNYYQDPLRNWIGDKPTMVSTPAEELNGIILKLVMTYDVYKELKLSEAYINNIKEKFNLDNILDGSKDELEFLIKTHGITPIELSTEYDVDDLKYFKFEYSDCQLFYDDDGKLILKYKANVYLVNVYTIVEEDDKSVEKLIIDKKYLKIFFTNQEKTWSVRIPTALEPVKIWKHSQFGNYEGQGDIKPTNWYGKQEPFEFEFVVNKNPLNQKLFNNLWFISNRVLPEELQIEIDGDSYDIFKYKKIIQWACDRAETEEELKMIYIDLLSFNQKTIREVLYPDSNYPVIEEFADTYTFKTLPYIRTIVKDENGRDYNKFKVNLTDTVFVYNKKLNTNKLRVTQKCKDISKYGRVAGNTLYLEDNYYIELRNMTIKDAYISNGMLRFKNTAYPRIRDKYMKIRVKYTGKDLALITQILTMFDYSYA